MNLEHQQSERRAADRSQVNREVRYRIMGHSGDETQSGQTLNMSSNGVLFTTSRQLTTGKSVELTINWSATSKLVARGLVVRSEQGRTALEIEQFEFRAAMR